MRKKDSIIYNSKQFLQHSIDVQEALQNIKKHAKASEATVLFMPNEAEDLAEIPNEGVENKRKKRGLKIIISDDGCGMSENTVEKLNAGVFEKAHSAHFGLSNIFERVQLLGGTVQFHSEKTLAHALRLYFSTRGKNKKNILYHR